MIKEVKMYTVICDNCGKDVADDDNQDYSCWVDEHTASENAMESDWIKQDEKHYCTGCASYDEDDNLVLKPIEPKTNQ